MNQTIELVLSLTLSGSILALMILAMKPFIKHKLSKSVQYYVWLIVLIRLIVPFSFEESIMNYLFQPAAVEQAVQQNVQAPDPTAHNTNDNINSSSIMPNVQQGVASATYNEDTERNIIGVLFNQYGVYIWMLGAIVSIGFHVIGYARFATRVKDTSIAASAKDQAILAAVWNGKRLVKLVRNRFVSSPMLIGIVRPYLIIPDDDFSDKQLKNILLHELVHLRRWDLAVKWFTMIVTSIHWFNPLMYFIKKEVHFACELACDEAVIKNLNADEKQAYGDTLISIAAGKNKYIAGALQVTMYEEKNKVKERLVAIMNFQNKPKRMVFISSIFVLAIILSASVLGASVGKESTLAPNATEQLAGYIVMEDDHLYLDEVEVITTKYIDQITGLNLHDPERIAELNINEADMPNGYYIHHMNEEPKAFELTRETTYTFTDFHLLFVEDADGDRLYTTTKLEEFIEHLTISYGRAASGSVPYFIEVHDGKVVHITEKLIFTL